MKHLVTLLFLFTPTLANAAFTDVPSDHAYAAAITWAQEEGIVEGYTDGTFKPEATINRAEFLKILLDPVTAVCRALYNYSDVDFSAWYGDYIQAASCQDLAKGYADGSFKPANTINFAEAAKIIVKYHSQGEIKQDAGEDWYYPFTYYLENHNAIPQTVKKGDQLITRSEMIEMMYSLQRSTTSQVQSSQVIIHTSFGNITLELYPDSAPKTVENFITHTHNGYYDGLTFHRVIPDFMIQGGDPTGNGTGGESIWGKEFEDEIDTNLRMERGSLAMANAGPYTNGSQFFIVQKEGGTPWLEGKHTIFGKVISGMEVVDNIANVETDTHDRPTEDVTMNISLENTHSNDKLSTITIYFYSEKDVKEATYEATMPIKREIPYSITLADQSLRALFAGPTAEESALGAYGSKDLQIAGTGYEGVTIYETFTFERYNEKRTLQNVAVIDFNSKPEVWKILNGPAGTRLQTKAAIESTLTFYDSIDSVLYRKNGEIFYLWDA